MGTWSLRASRPMPRFLRQFSRPCSAADNKRAAVPMGWRIGSAENKIREIYKDRERERESETERERERERDREKKERERDSDSDRGNKRERGSCGERCSERRRMGRNNGAGRDRKGERRTTAY